jgi:hypothetical protein
MNRRNLEQPDPRFPIRSPHHPRSLRDLDGRHSLTPSQPSIHGHGPFGIHSYTPSNSRPLPRPDPADFPCRVGGDPGPSNPPEPSNPSPLRRYEDKTTLIAHLTQTLETQKSDLSRLGAAYVAAGNDWERTRLQMVRLHQDVDAERHLDEHRHTIMEQITDVRRRFHEATVGFSLAQQAVDDTQAELDALQRGTPPPTSSFGGVRMPPRRSPKRGVRTPASPS